MIVYTQNTVGINIYINNVMYYAREHKIQEMKQSGLQHSMQKMQEELV